MTTETVPPTTTAFEPQKACLDGWDTYAETAEALEKVLSNGGHVGSCTAKELGLPVAPGEPGYESTDIVLAGMGHVPETVDSAAVPMVEVPATELPVTGPGEVAVGAGAIGTVLLVVGLLFARLSRRPQFT